jgi:hypothetical protein
VAKTTIATNLAAYYAQAGKNTVLVDTDRQGSSQRWCEKRVGYGSPVLPISGTRSGWASRIPPDTQRVIVDAPAGIRVGELAELIEDVHALVIPVLPSRIDLEASEAFPGGRGRVAASQARQGGGRARRQPAQALDDGRTTGGRRDQAPAVSLVGAAARHPRLRADDRIWARASSTITPKSSARTRKTGKS